MRDLISFMRSDAMIAAIVLVALAASETWVAWVRSGPACRPHQRFPATATLGVILAATIFRDGWPHGLEIGHAASWSASGWRRLSTDPLHSSQIVLNVILFAPAGAAWTLLWRSGRRAVIAGVVASVVIEFAQALLAVGAADIADVAANSIGAALGAGVAVFAGRRVGRQIDRRTLVIVMLTALTLGVAGVTVAGRLAAQRQRAVERELIAELTVTTRSEIDAMLSDPVAAERLFSRISVRPDGVSRTADAIELRYPATFLGLDRCVTITWVAAGAVVERRSGSPCTDPLT
jgi:hypothetical protein